MTSPTPRPPNSGKHAYRPDIDGLRAVAIVPVVLFHLGVAGFAGGYVGVDVFFVISGYLISSIILPEVRQGTFSFAYFYERRTRRLFPALFTVLAATTCAAVVLLLPSDLYSYGSSLVGTTLFGANILFWRTAGYFDGPAEMKPLLHTWSLAVEEQFYIVFPVLLLLLHRWLPGRMKEAITVVAIASFAASVFYLGLTPDAVFYLTTFRAWELMIGVLLALGVFPALRARWVREVLAIIAIALIGAAVVFYSGETPFPGPTALLPTIGTALLIHIGGSGSSVINNALSVRPLVFIGLISYPLYLWHWPLIVLLEYYLVGELGFWLQAAVVVVSVILAVITFRVIERPFRARGRVARGPLFFASASIAVGFLAIGGLLRLIDGWPGRLPPFERHLAATAAEDYRPLPSCYSNPLDNSPVQGCPVGAPGEPTFLVWGDSHAMAMFATFDSVARSMGKSGLFIAKAGCPPLIGVSRFDREEHDCEGFNDQVVDLINSTETIREVVLAARWAINANGTRYGVEEGEAILLSPRGIDENPAVFRAGLDRTLAFLAGRGIEASFLTQVPEIGWNVPSTLARASRFEREVPPAPTIAEYRARQRMVDEALEDVASRYPLHVVDVSDFFCGERTCEVIRAGRALYRDGHHLSLWGASTLAPAIARALRPPGPTVDPPSNPSTARSI